MKLQSTLLCLMLVTLATPIVRAQDQSTDNSSTTGGQNRPLASVSMQDKLKFLKARRQVLADHPDLKSEQDALTQQREGLKDASSEDRHAFFQNWMAHQKKMKEAML